MPTRPDKRDSGRLYGISTAPRTFGPGRSCLAGAHPAITLVRATSALPERVADPARPYTGRRDIFVFGEPRARPGAQHRLPQRRHPAAAARTLVEGSYISIELNTKTPVPAWDGQEVFIMQEDPAYLMPEGLRFFRPRQEALYLIG